MLCQHLRRLSGISSRDVVHSRPPTQPDLSRVARAPTLAKTRNLSSSGEQKSRSGEQTSEKVVTSAKMNVAPNSSRWKV